MELKIQQSWRKSRIAARLLLKRKHRPWNARDRAWAARLVDDPAVSNRLIDQAVHGFTARRRNGRSILDD